MLTALVLICSIHTTPDLRTCTRDNAVNVVIVPEQFNNPVSCLLHGQAYVAETAIGRELPADERIKIVCRPSRGAAASR